MPADDRASFPPFGGAEAAAPYDRARVAVVPVPYEGTVSWKRGTARGPQEILAASCQLELYDEQLACEPYRVGLWTDRPVPCPAGEPAERVIGRVEARTGALLDDHKFPLLLGGEHSITVGAVRAAARRHQGLVVVQLDAHADLRESYEGERFSHACAMARCLEHASVRAIGVRSYSAEEAARVRAGIPGYRVIHAWEMVGEGWQARVFEGLEDRPVYLTVDVDYFDPAIVPATGTPEPGGAPWWPTLALLERLCERGRVVAADLVELAPTPGLHHATFTVARLAYKLIGLVFSRELGTGRRA